MIFGGVAAQARLQDFGALVRRGLIFVPDLVTSIGNHVFNLYYITSECSWHTMFEKISKLTRLFIPVMSGVTGLHIALQNWLISTIRTSLIRELSGLISWAVDQNSDSAARQRSDLGSQDGRRTTGSLSLVISYASGTGRRVLYRCRSIEAFLPGLGPMDTCWAWATQWNI
jgi:hypothetical protein